MTSTAPQALIAPHGGTLVDLRLPADQWDAAIAGVDHRVECSDRNACDVELLIVGGFSPLRSLPMIGLMPALEHSFNSSMAPYITP